MKTLTIRNVSEDTHKKLKSMAVARGITIAEMLAILVNLGKK